MNRFQIFEFDNGRYRMFPEDKKYLMVNYALCK